MKIYDEKERTFMGLSPMLFGVIIALVSFLLPIFIVATIKAMTGQIYWGWEHGWNWSMLTSTATP